MQTTTTLPPIAKPLRFVWLLSADPYQRLCLRYWLLTSRLYVVMLALQAYSASFGLMNPMHLAWLSAFASCGILAFFVAIRSGWSKRLADPAVTIQQMGFGFAVLAIDYAVTPPLRSMVLMITPLALMFGAFTLTPRQCRVLGIFAVASQGVAMALSIWLGLDASEAKSELIVFVASGFVFTMVADMAGRLSFMRAQLRVQKRALAEALERNNLLARQDELTGLPNRRHAMEMMGYEERRAKREAVPPSVCILDIDHFKRINDNYGHPAGDHVLRLLATHAQRSLRGPDLLARWGGEEFVLVMPQTSVPDAVMVVERLRVALAQDDVWMQRPDLKVTFSAGIAALTGTETMEEAVARADIALYRAKQSGRNRTEVADDIAGSHAVTAPGPANRARSG